MAATPHYDISLDAKEIEDGAKNVIRRIKPSWNLKNIRFQHFTEGLSNTVVCCYQSHFPQDRIIVRVFGEKTDLMINRKTEMNTFKVLSKAGLSPPLYCTINNGMAYGYVKGRHLDQKMVKDENIRTLIAKEMAKFHSLTANHNTSGRRHDHQTSLLTKLHDFINLIPEPNRYMNELGTTSTFQQELDILKQHLETMTSDIVLCHNDLQYLNIIYDSQENRVCFIDYEYSFYNIQAFDIGNHFNKYTGLQVEPDYSQYPDRKYQLSWIRTYLEEYYRLTGVEASVCDRDVERLYVEVNKCALISDFIWGSWGLIQANNSKINFDFVG